jgi:putative membrane protein
MKKYFVVTVLAACVALAGCGDRNNEQGAAGAEQNADPAATANDAGDAATGTGINPATNGATGEQSSASMGGQAADAAMGGANPTEQERAALGALNAVNELEIAASNQALENNVSPPVAEYARMMVDEHTANREKTSAMNPQIDAPMATEQKNKGDALL